jgi:hypothetical protein
MNSNETDRRPRSIMVRVAPPTPQEQAARDAEVKPVIQSQPFLGAYDWVLGPREKRDKQ